MRFTADNVRLFCTPVINLFALDAEPIDGTIMKREYRVVPAGHQGASSKPQSVEAVEAFDHASAERYEYVPFSTFRHRGGMLRHEAPERYFIRESGKARTACTTRGSFSAVMRGNRWRICPRRPLVRVTGTNGMLPRKGLREASINELGESTPKIGACAIYRANAAGLPT